MNIKLIVVAVALVGLVALGMLMRGTIDKPVITAAKADASAARGVTVAVQRARSVEHRVAASDAAASETYQKGLEDGKKDLDGALARLGTALRLREQQLADARTVPAATASAGRRDASAPADFPATHGDDALRLAAEADDVARQLTACQALVRSDRQLSE